MYFLPTLSLAIGMAFYLHSSRAAFIAEEVEQSRSAMQVLAACWAGGGADSRAVCGSLASRHLAPQMRFSSLKVWRVEAGGSLASEPSFSWGEGAGTAAGPNLDPRMPVESTLAAAALASELSRWQLSPTGGPLGFLFPQGGELSLAFPVLPSESHHRRPAFLITAGRFIDAGEWWSHAGLKETGLVFLIFLAYIAGLRAWYRRAIVKPLATLQRSLLFARSSETLPAAHAAGGVPAFREIDGSVLELQAALLAERKRSDAIFKSMLDGFIAVDGRRRIVDFNPNMASMLRFDAHRSYRGEPLLDVLRIPQLDEMVQSAVGCQQPVEIELEIMNAGNAKEYFLVHVSPLEWGEGLEEGALIVFHDLTRVRLLEKMRTDFVSNVSHELKTPLTSMQGIIEMFEEKTLQPGEDQDKFIAILSRQARRLRSIIDDLLVLSRLENDENRHSIELTCAPIKDTIDLAVQTCHIRAEQKGIAVVSMVDPDLWGWIHPALLEQAAVNLVINAINYSPDRTMVTVGARQVDSEIEIFVKDQGIGIDPKHQDRVWERFYRVDHSRSRMSGGTGLGLSIVKHIALIHGGRVGLQSSLHHGSIFKIFIRSCVPK